MNLHTITRTFVTAAAACGFALGGMAAPLQGDAGQVLGAYYEIHEALAADDLAAAQRSAVDLAEKAGKLEVPAALRESAQAVAKAADMKALRTNFQALSTQVQSLAESAKLDATVYVMRCPMAFGGKGGTWLQPAKTVANPYYGAAMLGCGGIIKQIGAAASADPASSGAHGSH